MGQAKQRGSREDRIAQAKKRHDEQATVQPALDPRNLMETLTLAQRLDVLLKDLTTPAIIDDNVKLFAQELGGVDVPVFLDCQPEPWSRQSCCDLNVLEYIKLHGGKMLCGYRIWYTQPRYIEGERHAVWTDGTTIRDVSFVDTGESKTVFVPDDRAFDGAPAKVRRAFETEDKQALTAYEGLMSAIPTETMPAGQAWNTYPTYEQWLAGKRMSNLVPSFSRQ